MLVPAANCAATTERVETFTAQVPVPVHDPPQRKKVALPFGFSVNITFVPAAKVAEHLPGQAIPAGALVTDPLPMTTTANVGDVVAPAGTDAPNTDAMASATPTNHLAVWRR